MSWGRNNLPPHALLSVLCDPLSLSSAWLILVVILGRFRLSPVVAGNGPNTSIIYVQLLRRVFLLNRIQHYDVLHNADFYTKWRTYSAGENDDILPNPDCTYVNSLLIQSLKNYNILRNNVSQYNSIFQILPLFDPPQSLVSVTVNPILSTMHAGTNFAT